jgi:hypothetical protein
MRRLIQKKRSNLLGQPRRTFKTASPSFQGINFVEGFAVAGQARNDAAKTKTLTEFQTLSGLRLLAISLGNEREHGQNSLLAHLLL